MDEGSRWVAGAIAETALPGTAWGLVELELLEYFAAKLAQSHPKLCSAAPGEVPYDELFEEANDAAKDLLAKQDAQHQMLRTNLANVATTALHVNRAKAKFIMLKKRNLKAQLAQARHHRKAAREQTKREALEQRQEREDKARAEKKALSDAKKAEEAQKSKAPSTAESSDGDHSDSDSGSDDSSGESSDDNSESDDESSSEEDSSSSGSDSSSGSSATSSSGTILTSTAASSSTPATPASGLAAKTTKKPSGRTGHRAFAPGAEYAREKAEKDSCGVSLTVGFELAFGREQAAFSPGWLKTIMPATFHEDLADSAAAREARAAENAGLPIDDRLKTEMKELEGKIQAMGKNNIERRFKHFRRDASLLEPPAVDPNVRSAVITAAGDELLAQLRERNETSESRANASNTFQYLFEAQVKYTSQRALWQEAQRRYSPTLGDASQGNVSPSSSKHANVHTVKGLVGEAISSGLAQVPALRSKLATICGVELPSSLRKAVWGTSLLVDSEAQQCRERLRSSQITAGKTGVVGAEALATLPELPSRMLMRGRESIDVSSDSEMRQVEQRALALLVQAYECSSNLPTALGSLAVVFSLGLPSPAYEHDDWSDKSTEPDSWSHSASATDATPRPASKEPDSIAMLLRAHSHGVPAATRAAADLTTGVQALLEARWPRLLRHLHAICARADLADVDRRKGNTYNDPPQTMLQNVIEEEWMAHAFAGSLPQATLLWAWDQFALQGWEVAAELAASAFWLLRVEVRRLDRADGGATELRGVMRSSLRQAATLHQMQALLARKTQASREQHGEAESGIPQVMIRTPYNGR